MSITERDLAVMSGALVSREVYFLTKRKPSNFSFEFLSIVVSVKATR